MLCHAEPPAAARAATLGGASVRPGLVITPGGFRGGWAPSAWAPGWLTGAKLPSWVPIATRNGAVPVLPRMTFAVADCPSVWVADRLPVLTVRRPAFSAQSWRVTPLAATFTAAVAVAYPPSAAVNVVAPVCGENIE